MPRRALFPESELIGATRKVAFVVVSDRLSAPALEEALGSEPDAAQAGTERFPTQARWEIRAFGGPGDDLSSLIERVLRRIAPFEREIAALRNADPDLACVLRVTQYIGHDPVGPGFALDEGQVSLLSDLGAFVDVDQYALG